MGSTALPSAIYLSRYRSSPISERVVLNCGRPSSSYPRNSLVTVWTSRLTPRRQRPGIQAGLIFTIIVPVAFQSKRRARRLLREPPSSAALAPRCCATPIRLALAPCNNAAHSPPPSPDTRHHLDHPGPPPPQYSTRPGTHSTPLRAYSARPRRP